MKGGSSVHATVGRFTIARFVVLTFGRARPKMGGDVNAPSVVAIVLGSVMPHTDAPSSGVVRFRIGTPAKPDATLSGSTNDVGTSGGWNR